MPNTQFIEDIRISGRQIRDGIFAHHQPLKHRFVDYAAGPFFIRPYRLKACINNSGLYYVTVNPVEVDDPPAFILLLTKGHQDETDRFHKAPPE
jgi:hypothetical protein